MKTIEKLKAQELKMASGITRVMKFARWVQQKANEYAEAAIKKTFAELGEQEFTRKERLDALALEQDRIRAEIIEIGIARGKHLDNLAKF